MKFGLHYLLSCADEQSPVQRYRDTIEQAVRGEALGFESVWPVEQHFNRDASIMPCPTLLLAAIAERTHTLRLGTAIVRLGLGHPLRVAEEIATLDVLSNGRVEFGAGRGGNPRHFAGFGVPLAESRERMVESLAYLRGVWSEDSFSFAGRFFQADAITLAPRPIQRPHPPIRLAANSAETAEFAGRAGYPIMVASNINPLPKLREFVAIYRNARAVAGHAATADDVTVLLPLYVAANEARVRREVEPSVMHNLAMMRALLASAAGNWSSEAERQKMEALLEQMRRTTYDHVNGAIGIFDTPGACVDRLLQLRETLDPGRVICWFNFGGLVEQGQVLRSMELFSERVLPYV
jgi:natural product biosynthesis luciferase-like monooxygenase protein